jgi:AAA+ superfamily predicted ATPase
MMTVCPRELALAHLVLRLAPLQRALRSAVALRDAGARKLRDAGAIAAVISRGHADVLLDQLGDLVDHRALSTGTASLTAKEYTEEAGLRDQVTAAGARLPLDAIADDLGLDAFECELLVLCAAVELDADYEAVFGYVHDDAARRVVSIELACALTAVSLQERVARRSVLGPFGRLQRLGLIAVSPRETSLRAELRLTPTCVDALFGTPIDLQLAFHDPAEVALEVPAALPIDEDLIARAARALAEQRIDVVAIWGTARLARDGVAAISHAAGMAVRRYANPELDATSAAQVAAALGRALWIDLDALGDGVGTRLVEACKRTRVPLLVTGANPWRPTDLLAARNFVEIAIDTPDHRVRASLWEAALPEIDANQIRASATSFHFDATEVRAAARMARATAALHTNGHLISTQDCLRNSCIAVARKHGEQHTTLVVPRRGAEDLVLPAELHARVLDLVHNFRAMPRVMADWGFAQRTSGSGIKALFTGEPGTGKTLAAEVVAKELGLPMLKVDLARVVSKWIGETEKNLDHVFTEAHDSHGVLFFDEAEALFGSRGDVRHGTDRYANLEVSYLLQRLEDHSGIVILATNLRDKIDPAFMRRFHVVVGFPRPTEKERRRLWHRVFTPQIPLAGDLDVATLARLDLTGAGIVGAAQTAALLAARDDAAVSMQHVVRGLVRQFQREARVLTSHDLGAHAIHMEM